jgi:hypothetical protein
VTKHLRTSVTAGPVSRILSVLRRDGHSSGPRITAGLKRPTRRFGAPSRHACEAEASTVPPYLVLLRVGFALPTALLRLRCALTAPFHPYPGVAAGAVYSLWHFPSTRLEPGFPDVIRHTALRSSDFPPSFLDEMRATVRSGCQLDHYRGWSPRRDISSAGRRKYARAFVTSSQATDRRISVMDLCTVC